MSKKHISPYREGSNYGRTFDFMRKKRTFTRQEVVDFGVKVLKLKPSKATYNAVVLLSPRGEGKSKGDIRGHVAAHGHIHYVEKIAKKQGEAQRFSNAWRKTPLLPHRRNEVTKLESKKVSTKTKTTKTKTKAKRKANVKA